MKLLIWKIRFAIYAMFILRCSPKFAWSMADADESWFVEGYSPREAFHEELSYWDFE